MPFVGVPGVLAVPAYEETSSSRARDRTLSFAARTSEISSGDGERGAGTRGCPNRPVWIPAGESEGDRPASDAGEEMDLGEASEVGRLDFPDVSVIDFSPGQQPGGDEIPQTVRDEGVVVVVVAPHTPSRPHNPPSGLPAPEQMYLPRPLCRVEGSRPRPQGRFQERPRRKRPSPAINGTMPTRPKPGQARKVPNRWGSRNDLAPRRKVPTSLRRHGYVHRQPSHGT